MKQILESPAAKGKLQLPHLMQRLSRPAFARRCGRFLWRAVVASRCICRSSIITAATKLNEYVCPKDDPLSQFLRTGDKPYPADQARNIQLVEACNRNRVDFVWAIHPGKDIKWNEEDYQNREQIQPHVRPGVRSFAIHFDDIEGEGTDSNKQVDLLNRLNCEFVKEKGDVSPPRCLPDRPSQLWAKPGKERSARHLWRPSRPVHQRILNRCRCLF